MNAVTPLPLPPTPPQVELDLCPWRNPSLWVTWSDRVIDGQVTTFGHLWAFDMQLVRPARGDLAEMRVDIRVVFDCHVTTQKYDPVSHGHLEDGSPHLWADTGGHLRVFHPHRYELSKDLPGLIQGLPLGKTKCYGAQKNNYMVWKPQGVGFEGPHYQIYFDLYRTNEPKPRLVMYVQSAYLKDEPQRVQRENQLVFATVCAEKMGLVPSKTERQKRR